MNNRARRRWPAYRRLLVASCACLTITASPNAQEPLVEAKALYASAAYEDSLRLLAPLDTPEALQYKALCYLALGRTVEATRTMESVISAAPTFTPSATDVPPRFLTLFSDARRRMIPVIARRTFAEGRERFNAKQTQEALKRFDVVMALTADPVFKDAPEAQDMRTLAEGFIELAKASATPAPSKPAVPSPTLAASPTPSTSPATSSALSSPPPPTSSPSSPAGSSSTASSASPAKPQSGVPPAAANSAPKPAAIRGDVTEATIIRQDIPPFPTSLIKSAAPVAMVRLMIAADGTVTSATIERSAHVAYDRALLRAANNWRYKPATLNGMPVPTEKVVTIQIR